MKSIWYVHGAHSTERSFSFLARALPEHTRTHVTYGDTTPLGDLIGQLVEAANQSVDDIDLIGHSLGGVIAVAIAQRSPRVRRVVTLSAPFGGSNVAMWSRYFTPPNVLDYVQPYSTLLTGVRRNWANLTAPTLGVVTTGGGSPLIPEPNDGVITVASQTALDGVRYVAHPVNHFEVLLDDDVVGMITEHLW